MPDYDDIAVVVTPFSVKEEGIIKQKLPGDQRHKQQRKQVFDVIAAEIIQRMNLKINEEDKKEENNNFYVGKKQCLQSCVSVDLRGFENPDQHRPHNVQVQIKRPVTGGEAVDAVAQVTKPADAKQVKYQKISGKRNCRYVA